MHDGMPALKQARMNDAKSAVRKLDSDENVKDFEAFKLVCFNDPDVIALFDRTTTRSEVTQLSGTAKLKLVRIKERCNLWNWLLNFPTLASLATQLLPLHTTAHASERDWSK